MCFEYESLTVFMLAKKIKQANLTRKRSTNDIHSSNQLCADKRNQLHQIFMRGPPRHCKTSTSKKRNYIMPIPSKNQKAQVISEKNRHHLRNTSKTHQKDINSKKRFPEPCFWDNLDNLGGSQLCGSYEV